MKRIALAATIVSSVMLVAGCATDTTTTKAAAPAVQPMKAVNDLKSFLWVGNSFFYYNNGINGHVTQLLNAAEAGRPLRSTMVTISGSGFDWHDIESYFRPNGLGK